MAKPEVSGGKREPLPEGAYPFVVVAGGVRELPEWKHKFAILNWNENEEKRKEKADKENKPYDPQIIETFAELPWHKQNEWHIELKVRDGEHKGRWLPAVDLPYRWNPDKKWREKSKWFLFCKTIVPDCAKRADAGDLPDIDDEIVGFGGLVDVEVTDKDYNKNAGFRKDPDVFGKKLTDALEEELKAAGFEPDDAEEDIPF